MSAILFDLDGVLADSRRPIIDNVNAAFEALGIPRRSDAEIVPIIGPPTEVGFGALLGVPPEDDLVTLAVREYRARYVSTLSETRSYPGVPEAVRAIAQDRLVGVATSKPRRFALPILEAIGIAPLFAYVAAPEPGGPADKHAMVAEALAALPDAVGMVGDTRYDVEAARAHGLHAIGVTWGFGTPESLEAAGAQELVDDADALLTAARRLTIRPTTGP